MQFVIDVTQVGDTGWQVQVLDPSTGAPLLASPRALPSLLLKGVRFPLPPDDSLPADLDKTQLSDALQNVMNQSAGVGGVERFGRYLFSTMLGQDLWTAIDSGAGTQPIELALTWAPGDTTFDRLPWELMHTGKENPAQPYEGFLAAEPDVAIVRRVAGTRGAAYSLNSLRAPLRVLFVIGSSLSDPVIRPGAEYVGLMKHLTERGRVIFPKLLLNATTEQLALAVRDFKPSVVHVICHGQIREDGPNLLFRKPNSDESDFVNATRLREVLGAELADAAQLPRVLILNACSTAAADEATVGRPMAAKLVQLGIPVVVGMSGNVADQACRLFTRGFYGSLLDGGNIAQAAARGRRAAIAHGGYDPSTQVDWALPTLFLAEEVGDVKVDAPGVDEEAERLEQALEFSKRPEYPVFCGRWEVFEKYERLMSQSEYQSLAISIPRADTTDPLNPQPQYGGSRVLKELAAQAVRDGHIPILLCKDKEWLRLTKWPSDLKAFLNNVMAATSLTTQILSNVTQHHDLQNWDWNWLPLVQQTTSGTAAPDGLPAEFKQAGLSDEAKLAKALMLDLLDLRRTVCVQRGLAEEASVQVLLLIEDYHQLVFGDVFIAAFDRYGLRDRRAVNKIRCVITYNETALETQGSTVEVIRDWANSRDVATMQLGTLHPAFDPDNPAIDSDSFQRAMLVYKQFLLWWRKREQKVPLGLVQRVDNTDVQAFIASLAEVTNGGIPSELAQRAATGVIALEERRGIILRPADDDQALDDLANVLRKRSS
jgi:hypothetical protein